jgi:L,D-transpeptidase ErfK/SrfK
MRGLIGKKSCLLALVITLGVSCTTVSPAIASPATVGGHVIDGDLLLGEITTHTVKKRETLFDIARKYGLGIHEIQAANPGVDPWKPKAGTKVVVSSRHVAPSISREGIVINLSALRLYYFKAPGEVLTFPIAAGKEGWETPVAATKVLDKRKNPTWTIPARIKAENPDLPDFIPPGPNNPLGDYAMSLGLGGIMIHGTRSPSSIGKRASHGCIRMYPEHIEALFNAVPKGTPVLITKTPYVMGWQGDKLYLEVMPKVRAVKKIKKPAQADPLLHQAIEHSAGSNTTIYWNIADEALARADGIPVVIGSRSTHGPRFPEPTVSELPPQKRASLEIIRDEVIR